MVCFTSIEKPSKPAGLEGVYRESMERDPPNLHFFCWAGTYLQYF